MNQRSFLDASSDWFNDSMGSTLEQALAWLQTTYARVVATRITFNTGTTPRELLTLMSRRLPSVALGPWKSAQDAEVQLTLILEDTATAQGLSDAEPEMEG